jgi:hypothetical protein
VQLDQVGRAARCSQPASAKPRAARPRVAVAVALPRAARRPAPAPGGPRRSIRGVPSRASEPPAASVDDLVGVALLVRKSWRFCANSWSREPSVTIE